MDSNQLLALLQSTLDPNPNVRLQAELHLAQACSEPRASWSRSCLMIWTNLHEGTADGLLASAETALGLARIATEQQVDIPWRQVCPFPSSDLASG